MESETLQSDFAQNTSTSPGSIFIDQQLYISTAEEYGYSSNDFTGIRTPEVIPYVTDLEDSGYIPNVPNELIPKIGMQFDNLHDSEAFYRAYAFAAGFNVRKATSSKNKNGITRQFYVCNKAGFKEKRKQEEDTRKKRKKRSETRVGCEAKMVAKFIDDEKYEITVFEDKHNHVLYTPSCALFQKEGRKLNSLHMKMIMDNSKINIGAVKAFRQAKEYFGGYENIGASLQDFKNFSRDVKAYIHGKDGQMYVNYFKHKKEMSSSFFFEYELDDENCISRVLWADPISRKNYALYGDMVSFDTTYKTNRYSLIFGPFTGIDNHKRCITFAGCLIAKEDIYSFEWVFRTFLKAMQNNEPTYLITDQDPAMKQAIPRVFEKTVHRYCMWHIMKKMPEKIGRTTYEKEGFIDKMNSCVWSVLIEPEEFEEKWKEIITEYKLQDIQWMKTIYEDKKMWIPAYFRDLYLSGLMRTTSRSESENNFFTTFTNTFCTLFEFNMRFETALEAQRHTQGQNDSNSRHAKPICRTPSPIEKQASEFYTATVFYEFQKQIISAFYFCAVEEYKKENEVHTITVNEKNKTRVYQVVFNTTNKDTTCPCKMFQRLGIPCKHMIVAWNTKMFEAIPQQYILNRWTILASRASIPGFEEEINEDSAFLNKKRQLNKLWTEIHTCVSLVEGDEDQMNTFIHNISEMRRDLEMKNKTISKFSKSNKQRDIEMLIGTSIPTEIVIQDPKISKNKGTGVHFTNSEKRLKGEREKAIEKSKNKRMCNGCKQLCNHDIRNCPTKQKK